MNVASSGVTQERIHVVARVRPMSDEETRNGTTCGLRVTGRSDVEVLGGKGDPQQRFTYDAALGADSTQAQVYEKTAHPILRQVLNGYNGAVIAYGQTGSGKTYTMSGSTEEPGVIPRVICDLFEGISVRYMSNPSEEYTVYMASVQMYRESVMDLLADKKVSLSMETGLSGVCNVRCKYASDMEKLMSLSDKHRVVNETKMNAVSSRSHAVHIVTVSSRNKLDGCEKLSQLFLVDLAGSECVQKTGSTGVTLEEAKAINKSLLSLRRVIMSFYDGSPHIPYRDSVLTSLLATALGGNSKTCIIICVSPSDYNRTESVATLHFGLYTNKVVNVAGQTVVQSAKVLEENLVKVQRQTEALTDLLRKLRAASRECGATTPALAALELPRGVSPSAQSTTTASSTPASAIACVDAFGRMDPDFLCPLTGGVLQDPVVLADGLSYERSAAESHIAIHGCPPESLGGGVAPEHASIIMSNKSLALHIKRVIGEHAVSSP